MTQSSKKSTSKKSASGIVRKRKAAASVHARKQPVVRRAQAAKKPSSKLSEVDQIALAKLIDNPPTPTVAMLKAYARYQSLLV